MKRTPDAKIMALARAEYIGALSRPLLEDMSAEEIDEKVAQYSLAFRDGFRACEEINKESK